MSQAGIISTTSGPVPPSVPTSFVTDDGTATPALNILNVNGGPGVVVSANPDLSNNLLISIDEIAPAYVDVVGPATYNVTVDDYYISCNTSGGLITINLPDTPATNQQFIIKDRTGNAASFNITVKSLTGASTIDGQASYTFVDNFESLECLFHGANYEGF